MVSLGSIARVLVVTSVSLAAAWNARAQNLVANGGFESGDFSGWTTVSASSGSNFFVYPSFSLPVHSGAWAVVFEATAGEPDSIRQSLATISGERYEIEFWVYNSLVGFDSLRVYWEGIPVLNDTPCTVPYDFAWHKFTFLLTATGSGSELRFDLYDAPSFIMLDDIAAYRIIRYCEGDSNGDHAVTFADILDTLANWGASGPECP